MFDVIIVALNIISDGVLVLHLLCPSDYWRLFCCLNFAQSTNEHFTELWTLCWQERPDNKIIGQQNNRTNNKPALGQALFTASKLIITGSNTKRKELTKTKWISMEVYFGRWKRYL